MNYSISQIAHRFGLEPHTPRFYEQEGILRPRRSAGGIRPCTEKDGGWLEMVLCLKGAGMPLQDAVVLRGIEENSKIRAFSTRVVREDGSFFAGQI